MKEAQPRNADAGKYHLFHGLAIVHDQASLRRLRNLAALGWLGGVLRRSATQWSQVASEPGCKWPSHVDHGSANFRKLLRLYPRLPEAANQGAPAPNRLWLEDLKSPHGNYLL